MLCCGSPFSVSVLASSATTKEAELVEIPCLKNSSLLEWNKSTSHTHTHARTHARTHSHTHIHARVCL